MWHGGEKLVACWGGKEAQATLLAAFGSSAMLGLVSVIFSRKHSFESLWNSGQTSLLASQRVHGYYTTCWLSFFLMRLFFHPKALSKHLASLVVTFCGLPSLERVTLKSAVSYNCAGLYIAFLFLSLCVTSLM